MIEPTVTFQGVVTLSEAKRLVAAAEAAAQPQEGVEYRRVERSDADVADSGDVFRYVNGEWQFNWARGAQRSWITTFNGADLWRNGKLTPYVAPAPQPIIGQMYRHKKDTTDADPHDGGRWLVLRYDGGATWYWKTASGCEGFDTDYDLHVGRTRLVNNGFYVPYTPPVWTPKVGEWVVLEGVNTTARKVSCIESARYYLDYGGREGVCGFGLGELRPATTEEIAAAKRIEVRDGLLVKNNATGYVWQYNGPLPYGRWRCMSVFTIDRVMLRDLDTDHYTVLPEYTIKGVV